MAPTGTPRAWEHSACKRDYLHQWASCLKKKSQGIQAAGHSGDDQSTAGSVYGNEMCAILRTEGEGGLVSELRAGATKVRLRVQQAETEDVSVLAGLSVGAMPITVIHRNKRSSQKDITSPRVNEEGEVEPAGAIT